MKQELICEYHGGSHSYGLNTPSSDIDYRGVFVLQDVKAIIDPQTYSVGGKSIVDQTEAGPEDHVYYELRHFLHLLKKGNTGSLEMLFNNKWTRLTPAFESILDQRESLIDPAMLNVSVAGYATSEYNLAIGARTGKLGGKRQEQVTKYGFSPKNFVNLYRLLYSAETFYATGEFPVNLKDSYIFPQLMELKTHPERFNIHRLNEMYYERKEAHTNSWVKNVGTITRRYSYDTKVATQIILDCYIAKLNKAAGRGIWKSILKAFDSWTPTL